MTTRTYVAIISVLSVVIFVLTVLLIWTLTRTCKNAVVCSPYDKMRFSKHYGLSLTHCVVACNDNPEYYEFWPVVKSAWENICNVSVTLVLVAKDIPLFLREWVSEIVLWKPLPLISTAFQAQCIRLFYPAIVETEGAIIISDMDLIPLSRNYFVNTLESFNRKDFVNYRNVLAKYSQYPICFNAAVSEIWADMFDIYDTEDINIRLREYFLECGGSYAGTPGGKGWFCDQTMLWKKVNSWKSKNKGFVKLLSDKTTGHKRLNRGDEELLNIENVNVVSYTDFHMPRPYSAYEEVINYVLSMAQNAL